MIVFRDQRVPADPTSLLSTLRQDSARLRGGSHFTHDAAVDLLIAAGTLEAAVADAIFTDADGLDSITARLREVSAALGHVLWHTWYRRDDEARRWLHQAVVTLASLETQPLPEKVQISVPEGYAYYGVYPEMYLEAARRCRETLGSFKAVCIGLRSIGTSLSAVVVGALEELGGKVASYTLRPRGHPFYRRPVLTKELESALGSANDAFFLVIDEGPGLSGSSLAGTAQVLNELGIEDQRILLFPSWASDGSELRSEDAKGRWRRHKQFVVSFEEVWIDSGRMGQVMPKGNLHDISAGAWRHRLYEGPLNYPAVQPQHERRKYLFQPASHTSSDHSFGWLSFAGLGSGVLPKIRRVEQLARSGLTIGPQRLVHGFAIRPFIPGTPSTLDDALEPDLLDTMASYLAYISREQQTSPTVTESSLTDLVTTNVAEGLGNEWLSSLDEKLCRAGASWSERPVALDGRMRPHEWIHTDGGYLKVDAMDHHDDHFFPGCQDIAWDVAATCLEFRLQPSARRRLIQRYGALSNDRTISARLPLHAITYLAFRLGYAELAAGTLGESPDGKRFSAAATQYRRLLRWELSHTSRDSWDV